MVTQSQIVRGFIQMGARVKLDCVASRVIGSHSFRIDVERDNMGELFTIRHANDVRLQVLDVRENDRHLLLFALGKRGKRMSEQRSFFLCGHDERAWFAAAVPESRSLASVQDAKDALKPDAVWESMRKHDVPMEQRDRRWTKAFVRQGEWFFLPRPDLKVLPKNILANEPIQRGGGKPHLCAELFRIGGENVMVSDKYPNGITPFAYFYLPKEEQAGRWRTMTRDALVYVRGAVSHPDHDTIHLPFWHEVVMNTEHQAASRRNLAFLD